VVVTSRKEINLKHRSCDLLRVGSNDFQFFFFKVVRATLNKSREFWNREHNHTTGINHLDNHNVTYGHNNGHDYHNSSSSSNGSSGSINSNSSNGRLGTVALAGCQQHGLETQHVSSYRYVFFVVLFCSTTLMFILGHSTCRNGSGSNSGSTGSAIGSRRDTSRAAGVFLYKFLLN
jgi:hypothetical protein